MALAVSHYSWALHAWQGYELSLRPSLEKSSEEPEFGQGESLCYLPCEQ